MFCYRCTLKGKWVLSSIHNPDNEYGLANVVLGVLGPLPVGAHTWSVYGNKWEERTLTVTLLRSEAEVAAAAQRYQAAFEAAQAPKAALGW